MPHPQPEGEAPARSGGPAPHVTLLATCLEKPLRDGRHYRVIRLDNDLEALLIYDPETDEASAALDVNVGSFSDESDMPGMAHAVEHLLFLGSEKFPIENEFIEYILSHSGMFGALTQDTSTTFGFKVAAKPDNDEDPSNSNPSPLRGGLDRFAQFFIKPQFLASAINGELNVVDDENNMDSTSETLRLLQLEKSLSNPNHPYSRFSGGNFEVLKTLPEARGINVRDKFIEFHTKHYSANRMKLVVFGRESLDVFQKWVVELFGPIVNKKLSPNRWHNELPFRESDLGMQCFAKPVKDLRRLNLYFPYIDEELMYGSQPSTFISHLIGHEGSGSIMSYIKAKGWANGLTAGASPVCPGTPSIFEVQVRLTKEGLKNYAEIVKVLFQYVFLLCEAPPQEWIFQEQKQMADINFKFMQKNSDICDYTGALSSVMQTSLPREWLLKGCNHPQTFKPQEIKNALATIRPDNFRMTIVSQVYPGNWDKKEKWYGTEYRYEKIPDELMKDFEKAASGTSDRLPALHLPHKNKFIPIKLGIEKAEVAEPALAPRLLCDDTGVRAWWKKDDTFWVPCANVIVSLKTPLISNSAENNVKSQLFSDLVHDALENYAYDAKLAGLHYILRPDSHGLLLDIEGYNDKLPVLLEQIVKTMRNLNIDDKRFDVIKEQLARTYHNSQLDDPYKQTHDIIECLVAAERRYSLKERAVELPSINFEAVRQFQKQLLSKLHIEVYTLGNMESNDARGVINTVKSILKPDILPQAELPIFQSLILPSGSNYVYHQTLMNPVGTENCVETWFHTGDRGDRRVRAKTILLDQMIREPAFNQLRTKEQLGYVVWSNVRAFSTSYGIRFIVQGSATPEHIDSRIEAFLAEFAVMLEKMTDSDFSNHKKSALDERRKKPQNLGEESTRHWRQIDNGYYDFEVFQLDATHIERLTQSEMLDFFNKHLRPSSTQRARLSIHLQAQGQAEATRNGQAESQKKEHERAEEEARTSNRTTVAVEITDVRLFKSSLTASAAARPVKDMIGYK